MWAKLASLFVGDGGIVGKALDKLFVDANQKAQIAAAIMQEAMAQGASLDMAAADIVKAEATSGGGLSRSWPPPLLLVFSTPILAPSFCSFAPAPHAAAN